MISRRDLARFGGWKPVQSGEDSALIDDVVANGGTVFRAGGKGYVVVRHGMDHVMRREEAFFLERAKIRVQGWQPSLAGIDEVPEGPNCPLLPPPNAADNSSVRSFNTP